MRKCIARASTGVVIALLLAFAYGAGSANADAAASDPGGEVIVELRVWQDVNDQENLHVSARLQGGRWDAHGTRPVQLQDDSSMLGRYRYDTVSVGGVELGIWQGRARLPGARVRIEPNHIGYEYEPGGVTDGGQDTARLPIFVRACGKECPPYWREPGAAPLVLGDGHSPSGRYRYGDITVAVSPTPGLLADREYLLALRDPLAGTGALNWSAGTAVSQWEGVTAEGSPPRVTELRLSGLGLSGEMWGLVGRPHRATRALAGRQCAHGRDSIQAGDPGQADAPLPRRPPGWMRPAATAGRAQQQPRPGIPPALPFGASREQAWGR